MYNLSAIDAAVQLRSFHALSSHICTGSKENCLLEGFLAIATACQVDPLLTMITGLALQSIQALYAKFC